MKIGTKIRTLYQYSSTGIIVKPRRGEEPPTDWFIVRNDDGGRSCIHRDMMAVRND